MNKQLTIQENESMEHTPSEIKENTPFIPELVKKNSMSKVHPISHKIDEYVVIE